MGLGAPPKLAAPDRARGASQILWNSEGYGFFTSAKPAPPHQMGPCRPHRNTSCSYLYRS